MKDRERRQKEIGNFERKTRREGKKKEEILSERQREKAKRKGKF